MYVYVKFEDGTFDIVEDIRIHHFQAAYDKFKKYKVLSENKEDSRDALIVFTAESIDQLKEIISKSRPSVPASTLIHSASELSADESTKITNTKLRTMTNEQQKKAENVKSLVAAKMEGLKQKLYMENSVISNNTSSSSDLTKMVLQSKDNNSLSFDLNIVKKELVDSKDIKKENIKTNRTILKKAKNEKKKPIKKRKRLSNDSSGQPQKIKKVGREPSKNEGLPLTKINAESINSDFEPVTNKFIEVNTNELKTFSNDLNGNGSQNNEIPTTIKSENKKEISQTSSVTASPVTNNHSPITVEIDEAQPHLHNTPVTTSDEVMSNFNKMPDALKEKQEKKINLNGSKKRKNGENPKSSKKKLAEKVIKDKTASTENINKKKKNYEEQIKRYKSIIEKKESEIVTLRNLNQDLQKKVIDRMDEFANRKVNPFSTRAVGKLPLGHIQGTQIHCGNDVFMDVGRYREAVNAAAKSKPKDQYSRFVKSVAVGIIGADNLKNHSVHGRRCNKLKDSVAKPKIPDDKLSAVFGIFEHYLTSEKHLNPVEIELEQAKTGSYIAGKINDLNRKPRTPNFNNKSLTKPINSNPETNLKMENDEKSAHSEDADGSDETEEEDEVDNGDDYDDDDDYGDDDDEGDDNDGNGEQQENEQEDD